MLVPIALWQEDEALLGYVYNIAPDAQIAELRMAAEVQLCLSMPFEILGANSIPLHPAQERILQLCDMFGSVPVVRLRLIPRNITKESFVLQDHSWRGLRHLSYTTLYLHLPMVVSVISTVAGFTVGASALIISYFFQPLKSGLGSRAPGPDDSPPKPNDDYEYYLDTFRRVWEATLNAMTLMINTYLNGPITILCNCLDHIIGIVGQCVMGYLQIFQHCWDTTMDPKVLPWIALLWGIILAGTALVVHVVLRDAKGLLPWPWPGPGTAPTLPVPAQSSSSNYDHMESGDHV